MLLGVSISRPIPPQPLQFPAPQLQSPHSSTVHSPTMSSPPEGLIMVIRARAPRIRALFRIILSSRWSQQLLFWVAEQWCGLSWEGILKIPKPHSVRLGFGQSEKSSMMTPQLSDEDFVLRGLKGTGKSPGSDAASTQIGPEGSVYERRESIKSESSHICVYARWWWGWGFLSSLMDRWRYS